MLTDKNDYPLPVARRVVRSAMFRSGLAARLGPKYWRPTDSAPYIHVPHRRTVQMFDGIPAKFADPAYDAMIGPDSARWSRHEETITAIDDCWVEPNRCQIIGRDGRLVKQSLTHRLVPMFPSALGYARRGGGERLAEAIVHDGFNSVSYFHHLVDTMPNIILFLDRSGLAPDMPLIVNRWIFESRFFTYLRERSPAFAALNWRVQEPGEWLHVGRAYRLSAAPYDRETHRKVRAMYGRLANPPGEDGSGGRRVFLSRDPKMFGRGIANEREVAALLASLGFETIYAEHLTLAEQQRIFEETTHLVALHGMGLVQQLFMDPDRGHVLELMPGDRLHSVYYWLGWTLGMRFYDVQSGSAMDESAQYRVDLGRLEAGVRRMLDHPAGQRRYGETLIA